MYKGLWKGTVVAVKTIVLPSVMSGQEKREKMAIMEAAISSALSHPNIMQVECDTHHLSLFHFINMFYFEFFIAVCVGWSGKTCAVACVRAPRGLQNWMGVWADVKGHVECGSGTGVRMLRGVGV